MASRSQMRLAQLTGSLNSGLSPVSAQNLIAEQSLQGVMDHLASAIKRITGEDYHAQDEGIFNVDAQISGSLRLRDAADFDSTLDVQGAANLQSALTVDGLSTFNGNADFDGTSVSFSAHIDSDMLPDADGTRDLGSTTKKWNAHLELGAIAALSASSAQVGDLTDNEIVIAGPSGELEGDSNFRFDGTNFDIGAASSEMFRVVVASGATTIEGAIDANSTSDFQGAMNLQDTITVAGDADLNGALDVAGQVDLGASGGSADTTVRGDLTVDENLAVTGNAVITGDLTVNGSTTTLDTQNLLVEDPLIVLAKNQTGAAALDQGMIFQRSGDNYGMIWDESADEFAFINATTEDGTTSGDVSFTEYADLHVGALSGSSISTDLAQNHVVYTNASGDLAIDSSVFQYDTTNLSVGSAFDVTVASGLTRVGKLEIDSAADYIDVNTDLQIVASADIELTAGSLKPNADDGVTIGESGLGFSDLYLADGAVIDFDSSDVTMTHSANLLSIAGGNTRVERLEVDSNADYIDVVGGSLTAVAVAAFEVDAGSDIILDHAAGAAVKFQDANSEYGKIEYLASSDLSLVSESQLFLSSSNSAGIILDSGDGSIALQNASVDFGTIASTSGELGIYANAQVYMSGSEIQMVDYNRAGSTWTQGYVTLSDATSEWDDYEAALGGEYSLLKGITLAAAGSVNAGKWTKVYAEGASSVSAGTAIALSGFSALGTSIACNTAVAASNAKAIDVYVNGQLMLEGAANDFEIASGDIDFSFDIEGGDVIQVVIR